MNNLENKKSLKKKVRKFSDEVFRNYLTMRLRWRVSSLERKRSAEINDLGNRVFRLYKKKKIEIPGVEALLETIMNLETQIEIQEENLREIIMREDVPRQLPEKTSSETLRDITVKDDSGVLPEESKSKTKTQNTISKKLDTTDKKVKEQDSKKDKSKELDKKIKKGNK